MVDTNTDGYWGPWMQGIVRNMAREMSESGWLCTPQDVYLALVGEQGREKYAASVSDERMKWIDEYAACQFADMDDDNLEPLIDRLERLVGKEGAGRTGTGKTEPVERAIAKAIEGERELELYDPKSENR